MNTISRTPLVQAHKRSTSQASPVTDQERRSPLTVDTTDGRQFTLTPYGNPVNVSDPPRDLVDIVVDSCRTQLPQNQSAPGGSYNLVIQERDGSGTCAATTAPILPNDLPRIIPPEQLTPNGLIRRVPEGQSATPPASPSPASQPPSVLRNVVQEITQHPNNVATPRQEAKTTISSASSNFASRE